MTELRAMRLFYSDGKLVEMDDDALGIVRQVRDLYGDKISVSWEETSEHFVFVEHGQDGTDRLIFTTPHLDQRDLDRLLRSDSQLRGYEDPYDRAEREQDEFQAEDQRRIMEEKVMPAAEELAWSIGDGSYGPGYKQSIRVSKDLHGPDSPAA